MRPNLQETVDLVAFTEEILHEKLHFRTVLGEFGRNKFARLRLWQTFHRNFFYSHFVLNSL